MSEADGRATPPASAGRDKGHPPGGLFRWAGPPVLVDSITEAVGGPPGRVIVSGSHGGISAGRFALQARPHLVVFNDAGIGKDEAGVAALALLDAHGIAACTVASDSARIGEAASTLADGVVSRCNEAARALGLAPGLRLAQVLAAG